MLIKGKKITMCGEDKLYFPEGCWTGCPTEPNISLVFSLYDPEDIHRGQYAPGEVARFILIVKNIGDEDIKNVSTWIGGGHDKWQTWDAALLKVGEERQYFYELTIAPDGMINYRVGAETAGYGAESNTPVYADKRFMINVRIR